MGLFLWMVCVLAASATAPTTAASPDAATDYLLNAAAPMTAPARATTMPTTSPLTERTTDVQTRQGIITMSDGQKIAGDIATTAGKPLRVWDEQAGEFRDLPIQTIASITAQVLWEKEEPQWRFKESGSDIKIETGKTYPSRETAYRFALTDGSIVTGGVVAPLMIRVDGQSTTYILHKRDKGDIGQTLGDLKFVKSVEFGK